MLLHDKKKFEVALISKDLDPMEKEALEEAMVQSVIKASLNKSKDNIIEIDPGVEPIRSRPMYNANGSQIDIVLSIVVGEDNARRFEAIYGPPTSDTILYVQVGLERRKVL